jgi:hypothetical protein
MKKKSITNAWREIHEAKRKADAAGDAAAQKIAAGWGELEEPCHTKSDLAAATIAAGMDQLAAASEAVAAAEAAALVLAKGDNHVKNMQQYMVQPIATRFAPYI